MSSSFSYDAIADVYATDMGRSMPFDDIGWYRALCLRRGGRTLELGCGTGRVLINLMRAGVDAIGADRSLPMLRRLRVDAALSGITPQVLQMDLSQPAVAARFRTILLPYSLITYLVDTTQARRAVLELSSLLDTDGLLVLDAFVPKPVVGFTDFRLDYRRAHGDGELERHKRITVKADGTNRIERRYRRFDHRGALVEEFMTDETIRPLTPDTLLTYGTWAGLAADDCIWDYGASADSTHARFATVCLRRTNC